METSKIETLPANCSTELYARTGNAEYTLVKIVAQRFMPCGTDPLAFETFFLDGEGREYAELFVRKDDKAFSRMDGKYMSCLFSICEPSTPYNSAFDAIRYRPERKSFFYKAYPLDFGPGDEIDVSVPEFTVQLGKPLDVSGSLPAGYCLNKNSQYIECHSRNTVIRDGVTTENRSLYERARLTADETEFLKGKFAEIEDYCKGKGIKIFYSESDGKMRAGHYDVLSYDSFEYGEEHSLAIYLDPIAEFAYAGEEEEFVIKPMETPKA